MSLCVCCLLLFFFASLQSSFFVFCLLVSFCFPGSLVVDSIYICFYFCFLPLFFTPHDAYEPEICETNAQSLVCPFLVYLGLFYIASLPDLNIVSLSSILDVCVISIYFSIFDFDFSTSSCILLLSIFWIVCGPLGFCGDFVLQRAARI